MSTSHERRVHSSTFSPFLYITITTYTFLTLHYSSVQLTWKSQNLFWSIATIAIFFVCWYSRVHAQQHANCHVSQASSLSANSIVLIYWNLTTASNPKLVWLKSGMLIITLSYDVLVSLFSNALSILMAFTYILCCISWAPFCRTRSTSIFT